MASRSPSRRRSRNLGRRRERPRPRSPRPWRPVAPSSPSLDSRGLASALASFPSRRGAWGGARRQRGDQMGVSVPCALSFSLAIDADGVGSSAPALYALRCERFLSLCFLTHPRENAGNFRLDDRLASRGGEGGMKSSTVVAAERERTEERERQGQGRRQNVRQGDIALGPSVPRVVGTEKVGGGPKGKSARAALREGASRTPGLTRIAFGFFTRVRRRKAGSPSTGRRRSSPI